MLDESLNIFDEEFEFEEYHTEVLDVVRANFDKIFSGATSGLLQHDGIWSVDDHYEAVAAIDPVECALHSVGISRVNGLVDTKASFVPHNRQFDFLHTGAFSWKGKVVTRWAFPVMGAEPTQKGLFTSYNLNMSDCTLYVAQTSSGKAIGGVRPKLDGVEVVVFVAHFLDGDSQGFCYDSDSVYLVHATMPSLYERVGSVYYLLSGPGSESITHVVHNWYEPSYEGFDRASKESQDGVIINVNGVDHKVKHNHDITLLCTGGKVCSQDGRPFVVVGDVGPFGYNDYVVKNGQYFYSRPRPDRIKADSSMRINHLLGGLVSVNVSRFFPLVNRPPRSREELVYVPPPPSQPPVVVTAYSQLNIGPASWSQSPVVFRATCDYVCETIAWEVGRVLPAWIGERASLGGYYAVGQLLKPAYPDTSASVHVFQFGDVSLCVSARPPACLLPCVAIVVSCAHLSSDLRVFGMSRFKSRSLSGSVVLYFYMVPTIPYISRVLKVPTSVVEEVGMRITVHQGRFRMKLYEGRGVAGSFRGFLRSDGCPTYLDRLCAIYDYFCPRRDLDALW